MVLDMVVIPINHDDTRAGGAGPAGQPGLAGEAGRTHSSGPRRVSSRRRRRRRRRLSAAAAAAPQPSPFTTRRMGRGRGGDWAPTASTAVAVYWPAARGQARQGLALMRRPPQPHTLPLGPEQAREGQGQTG